MRGIFASLLIVLLATLIVSFAAAQEFPIKGPATGDPEKNSSQPNTYQGCVVRSNAGLMLNSALNHQYKLTGTLALDSYVGQEVQIVAYNMNPNDPSSGERSMSAGEPQNTPDTLVVEEIQKMSDSCTAQQ